MVALLAALSLLRADPLFAIQHVTIVDMRTGTLVKDETVVIRGNKIDKVGPAVPIPRGITVIDGRGKYLIPGLWDMHAHNDSDEITRGIILPLMIANGVTGMRDMCADVYPPTNPDGVPLEVVNGWRRDIAAGRLDGPRIIASSTLVDGPNAMWPSGSLKVANAEEGRRAADYVKNRGCDFLKVYSMMPRDGYFAMAEECKKIGLIFAGHVPESITAEEASNAGQKSMEHLLKVVEGCSTQPVDPVPSVPLWLKRTEDKKRLVDTFNPKLAEKLFAVLVKNHSWQCPTTTILRSTAYRVDSSFRHDPRLAYLPKSITDDWNPDDKYWVKGNPAYWKATRDLYELELRIIGQMAKAGVPILAGTDSPTDYVYPGFSLQDELQLLVSAGMTPLQALQASTLRAAEYLGLTASFGTVEAGKTADLDLLDGNPLADIRNTTHIAAVFANGRYYSRERLISMLAEVKARAAASKG
jgi:hypothetical protein